MEEFQAVSITIPGGIFDGIRLLKFLQIIHQIILRELFHDFLQSISPKLWYFFRNSFRKPIINPRKISQEFLREFFWRLIFLAFIGFLPEINSKNQNFSENIQELFRTFTPRNPVYFSKIHTPESSPENLPETLSEISPRFSR